MAADNSRATEIAIAFGFARDRFLRRLEGMTDDEYFWEPAPGCWSVRPVAESAVGDGLIVGGWIQEGVGVETTTPPFTTIAWRLTHLCRLNTIYRRYAFASGQRQADDPSLPHTAREATELWSTSSAAFVDALLTVADSEWNRAFRSATGESRTVGAQAAIFVAENIHHGAEVACLRDLYRILRPQP